MTTDLKGFYKYLRKHVGEGSANVYLRTVAAALMEFPLDPSRLLYRKQLTYSTKNTYQAALRHWAEFTEDKGLHDKLHSDELRQSFKDQRREEHRSKDRHDVQPFSKEEERRIHAVLQRWREDDSLPVWQWPAVSMMFSLGLRAGADLANLTKKDAEAALRSGIELVIVTKGSKERTLPAVLVLDELRTLTELTQPWGILADLIVTDRAPDSKRKVANAYERLRQCVKRLADEVDIPQKMMHTHRFRHNAANRLYEVTGDLVKVQQFLGHNDGKTTMRYLKKHHTEAIGQDLLAAMKKNLEE